MANSFLVTIDEYTVRMNGQSPVHSERQELPEGLQENLCQCIITLPSLDDAMTSMSLLNIITVPYLATAALNSALAFGMSTFLRDSHPTIVSDHTQIS